MLAMFFFLALYLQNILHYSPIETGVRFLPSTVMIIFMGPIAGRLADRVGPRPLIVLGMIGLAGTLFWQSFIDAHTSYTFLLPAFVLMGLAMGLVMSPMSTAGMNAVDPTKAGVASGTLSMSRMVGGTFGIAVLGALIQAVGRAKLDDRLPAVPAGTRHKLAEGLGQSAAGHHFTAQIAHATTDAYVAALQTGLRVSSGVALLGAVLAAVLIAGKPRQTEPVEPTVGEHVTEAELTAEPARA
jgi:MFS family permease